MNKHNRLAAFAKALRGHKSYVISSHVNPDPDSIGSMLAVGWGLQALGKQVVLVASDPVPARLQFLPGADKILQPPVPKADVLLVVDCDLERTGRVAEQSGDFAFIYNLDHHVSNVAAGPTAHVDPSAAATGELVLDLLADHWSLTLDADAAFNLYAAIMTDTGGFRFNNTTSATLRAAARLVDAGVRPGTVAGSIYENMTWPSFLLLRAVLQSLCRSDDGRIAWIILTKEMLAASGATEDDAVGLAQYPRMISGVQVALVLRELDDDKTRVSLRSKGAVDVSVVAGRFGGGGHVGAAGCTMNEPPSAALPLLLAAVQEVVDLNGSERADRPVGGERERG